MKPGVHVKSHLPSAEQVDEALMGGDAQGAHVTEVKQPVWGVLFVHTPPQRCCVSEQSGPPELDDAVVEPEVLDAEDDALVLLVLPLLLALVLLALLSPDPPAPPAPPVPPSPKNESEPWAQPTQANVVTRTSPKPKRGRDTGKTSDRSPIVIQSGAGREEGRAPSWYETRP